MCAYKLSCKVFSKIQNVYLDDLGYIYLITPDKDVGTHTEVLIRWRINGMLLRNQRRTCP